MKSALFARGNRHRPNLVVRRVRASVAMSVALHAIAIAVMVGHHGADPVVVRPPVPPAPAEPPPVEIRLWTEPSAVSALGPADLAPAAHATSPAPVKPLHAPRVAASIAPRAAEPEVSAAPARSLAKRWGPDLRISELQEVPPSLGERMQAGARYRERELGNAGSLMAHNLDQLWATVPDLAERKRQLFALWDECSETGTEADIAAGVRARARVIAFIHTHLPAGSAGAFTSAELAALNGDKQSHEQFAPYAE